MFTFVFTGVALDKLSMDDNCASWKSTHKCFKRSLKMVRKNPLLPLNLLLFMGLTVTTSLLIIHNFFRLAVVQLTQQPVQDLLQWWLQSLQEKVRWTMTLMMMMKMRHKPETQISKFMTDRHKVFPQFILCVLLYCTFSIKFF